MTPKPILAKRPPIAIEHVTTSLDMGGAQAMLVKLIEAGAGNPPINRTYADPAGALACATATMLALAARERTGRGQYVETTMLSRRQPSCLITLPITVSALPPA